MKTSPTKSSDTINCEACQYPVTGRSIVGLGYGNLCVHCDFEIGRRLKYGIDFSKQPPHVRIRMEEIYQDALERKAARVMVFLAKYPPSADRPFPADLNSVIAKLPNPEPRW